MKGVSENKSRGNKFPPEFPARNTATFTPYYWEAYNEIVQPRRFDWYLVTKWAPDLGALGFLIVKVVRNKCFHNPLTGVLRNSCEINLDELAVACGTSKSSLVRELKNNKTLQKFVRKVQRWECVGTRVHQLPNRYEVCMDDPIHDDDMEHYEYLRAKRENERNTPSPLKVVTHRKTHDCQSDNHVENGNKVAVHDCQIDNHNVAQFDPPYDCQSDPRISNLPFGELLTKESLTCLSLSPATDVTEQGRSVDPPIYPPKGKEEELWETVLSLLESRVNTPTLKTHLGPARITSITETKVTIAAVSEFSRSYLESRHLAILTKVLTEILGRAVTVEIVSKGK